MEHKSLQISRKINPSKYAKDNKQRTYSSKLDPYKELILTKFDTYYCSAKSIYLLIKDKYGYTGNYSLVNKFVSNHKKSKYIKQQLDIKQFQVIKYKWIGRKNSN